MSKTMLKSGFALALFVVGLPKATAMLGVSTYAATKAVDAIMIGMGFWSVVSILMIGAGAFAGVWFLIKRLIKRIGRTAAIAW